MECQAGSAEAGILTGMGMSLGSTARLVQLLITRTGKGVARLERVNLCKDWSTSGHLGLPLEWQPSEGHGLALAALYRGASRESEKTCMP